MNDPIQILWFKIHLDDIDNVNSRTYTIKIFLFGEKNTFFQQEEDERQKVMEGPPKPPRDPTRMSGKINLNFYSGPFQRVS